MMERLCQNKWQNGVTIKEQQVVFGIPLAGESVLRIDCSTDPPQVTTWPLPTPCRGLSKWEGAVVAPNGVVYTVPNNHKPVLRIEQPPTKSKVRDPTPLERPDYRDREDLVYKSGIPTLRSSAHRVKFSPKDRKHDPKPKNQTGEETNTLWLPDVLCQELVFSYDSERYDLAGALVSLLKRCDPDIVGKFGKSDLLEDFMVPTQSTWRTVNGGQCESAQKYLSDMVATDEQFLTAFDRLVEEFVLPHLKARLVAVGAVGEEEESVIFYYQRPPTLRLQPGPAWAQVKPHNDAEYGHQNGELNFWIPLTDRTLTGVDLWCESSFGADDYHPVIANPGEIISFHGSSCRHYVNANASHNTRVSMDFRVGVQGFFDPFCSGYHGRKDVQV
jgi:hypothetical protein